MRSYAPSMPRWSASGDPGGRHARGDCGLRGRAAPRLPDPDHHPGALDVGSETALQPPTAGGCRVHRGGHGPVPQPLPALPATDRRRWILARPEPDPRDHPADHRPAGGCRAHRRVRPSRLSGAAAVGWRRALMVCGAVVLIDQVSKAIVVSSLSIGQHESIGLGFSLTNTPNTGLAFGIGQGEGFVLAITIVALALVLVWFALDPTRPGLW